MNQSIRVLLADDHTMVRRGLAALLTENGEVEIVAEAENGREAVEKTLETHPEVVIMDISMPEMTGIEATRALKEQNPEVRILALSMYDRNEYIRQAIKAGADGYILKTDAPDMLVEATRQIAAGQRYFSSTLDAGLVRNSESNSRGRNSHDLTARETEILRLIADGLSNRLIAEKLNISPRTVAVHRMNLMKKLAVHNAPSLLRRADKEGLLAPRA